MKIRTKLLALAALGFLAAAVSPFGALHEPMLRGAAYAQSQLLNGTVFFGRMYSAGAKPTTVTCTIQDNSTNRRGRVTAAGGATSCVITFVAEQGAAAAWTGTSPPVCVVVDETAVRASMTTAVTTTTLTVGALTTADIFVYMCEGGQ